MGLTIHYGLTSTTRSTPRAMALVEQMRQLALDLPFESVDDKVQHLGADVCQRPFDELRPDADLFSTVLDGCKHVDIPWHRKQEASVTVQPLEIISFWTEPGPGSEWASFGLARYPAEVEVIYSPRDDDRFIKTITNGCSTHWQFDRERWQRWLKRNGHNRWDSPEDEKFQQKRKIRTGLSSGWRYSTFCKTQYSSGAQYGGIPNFVRCHLSVIHLLDRIAQLPTMTVEIDDEGKYGRSYYTDDPYAEKRVYTWHEGKYNVKALVEEVGEWNQMLAVMSGAINDMLKTSGSSIGMESPISAFPDFEHLEFKGQQNHQYLVPFLQAMKQLADEHRASGEAAEAE
ncbi:MAG: hypothetical protein ACLQNE_32035 [Thermoguttaceae bacterium]|jgi:hypothetical protein